MLLQVQKSMLWVFEFTWVRAGRKATQVASRPSGHG
jgi:hypothetical protein